MAPIGSVLKNSIVYIIVVSVATFVSVNTFLFQGLVDTIQYANGDASLGTDAITGLFLGILTLFIALGLGLALSIPNIVGDEMVEF